MLTATTSRTGHLIFGCVLKTMACEGNFVNDIFCILQQVLYPHLKAKRRGAPMKYEAVTIRHRMIEAGNDETIDEFKCRLEDGTREWANRNKLTVEEVSQQLCKTLLERLQWKAASLITPETITKIHGGASANEGAALAENICNEISRFLRVVLICMSGIPLRGRRRQFSNRDRQICEMRRRGLSYGRIGQTLHISRNAVQAAYRRERQRREFLCRHYPDLQEFFGAFGIILEAAKPAN